jgi:hypothetical protein
MAQAVAQVGNTKQKLTPAQKASMFAAATRQNWQIIPGAPVTENNTVSFTIPKARLLSRTWLKITGNVTLAHATLTSLVKARMAPWNLIKQIRLQVNNGFNPYQVSGKGVYLYNGVQNAINMVDAITTMGITASPGGTVNAVDILVDLTSILNDRDPVGLILAQNQETVITITIDFGTIAAMFSTTAVTASAISLMVTPVTETFTVPASPDAMPDLSVLKLVAEQNFNIPASGSVQIIKLPVGQTYRKIIMNFEDAAGVGMTDANIGNLSLMFNQADVPYNIPADVLRKINTKCYGAALPAGVLVWDLSDQGIANMGGSRDLIDTERLTEFWVSFIPGVVGNVQVVSETLTRLQGV